MGLQARGPGGESLNVPAIDDTMVINIGDSLMRWTNDKWISTQHGSSTHRSRLLENTIACRWSISSSRTMTPRSNLSIAVQRRRTRQVSASTKWRLPLHQVSQAVQDGIESDLIDERDVEWLIKRAGLTSRAPGFHNVRKFRYKYLNTDESRRFAQWFAFPDAAPRCSGDLLERFAIFWNLGPFLDRALKGCI